jgi:hypothetical protein
MSIVAIYSFEGRFAGKSEYEFFYPEVDAVHKCMLFLVQVDDVESWEGATAECAKYGFTDIQPNGFGVMIPEVLDEEAYQGFRVNYDEALQLGSSLIYYANA